MVGSKIVNGEGKVELPIQVNLVSIEIKNIILSDTEPAAQEGYEVLLLKDLGYTKLWIEFKVI